LFKRIVRRGDAVLGVVEEFLVYKLFGVKVEEGLECIREYLWDNLFRVYETREGFERLWERELKPLAERALRDTYKVFHYSNLRDSLLLSNDAGLLGRPQGEMNVTLVSLDLEGDFSSGIALIVADASDLRFMACSLVGNYLGDYFVLYADEVLENIAKRYGEDAWEHFGYLCEDALKNGYPAVVAASVVVEEDFKKRFKKLEALASVVDYDWRLTRPVAFCLVCDEHTLEKTWVVHERGGYMVDLNYFWRVLEGLGYKLEILDRLKVAGEEWIESLTLGALRNGEGLCLVFVEREVPEDVELYTTKILCRTLNELIEGSGSRMEDPDLLELGELIANRYLGVEIEELPKEAHGRIGLEYLRMRREGRWHGRVDLGRWVVYMLASPPGKQLEPALLIDDREAYEVRMIPLKFTGSLKEAEERMKKRRDLLESWYKTVVEREDSPPELLEIMTSIIRSLQELKRLPPHQGS